MKITFWGVRGSIPIPGPDTIQIGGNTSCVEVSCGTDVIIFDGGTGLRPLGQDLLHRKQTVDSLDNPISIFFSHVHWDHIHGFPFFSPAFKPGLPIDLYGAKHSDVDLESALRGQMIAPHFPLTLRDMPSMITFKPITAGDAITIGESTVISTPLNHPNGSFGYRIKYKNRSCTYICDHEHSPKTDFGLKDFANGTDVLIYDAQYTPEEYLGKDGMSRKGWGHSTWEEGTKLANSAKVGQLLLYHHGRCDTEVKKIEVLAKSKFKNTQAAYEGLTLNLQ